MLRLQITASDPAVSAWVAANAGSGKTHVLAQRVIRLLLDGVEPGKILCITFTKAAAANMANRVFDELRRWTALDDEQLDAAIRRMSNLDPDPARRARARRLFALALETPGGLKVQTIHAFCTRLLHQFPFEATVAARFDVLDEASEAQLLGETSLAYCSMPPWPRMPRSAERSQPPLRSPPTGPSRRSWAKPSANVTWCGRGSITAAASTRPSPCCAGRSESAADDTLERVESEMMEGPLLPFSRWAAAAQTLMQGLKERSGTSGAAHRLRSQPRAPNASASISALFHRQTRSHVSAWSPRQCEKSDPELADCLQREGERLLALVERRKAVACRNRTAALLTIADAVISRYQRAKDQRGLLDYDDLIDKALALLGEDRAAWVHYKLDQGIDHVLIDEAQDTSPKQWEIIRLLTG